MKKYLPHIDLIALISGALGILLRFWLLRVGEDEKGLYPAHHISWIALLLLTGAVLVALFLIAGSVSKDRSYRANFPASLPGALGYVAAATGLVLVGIKHFGQSALYLYPIAGAVALLSAAVLLLGGWCRFKGTRPHFLVFALPCLYFALRLFCMGHTWGDEPELQRFLFPFLATAVAISAFYQLWAFCVGLGNRSSSLLCSLLTVYLCLVSVPGENDGILFLTLAIFLFLNLCSTKEPVRRAPAAAQPEEAPAPRPEELLPQDRDSEIDAIIAEIRLQTDELKE